MKVSNCLLEKQRYSARWDHPNEIENSLKFTAFIHMAAPKDETPNMGNSFFAGNSGTIQSVSITNDSGHRNFANLTGKQVIVGSEDMTNIYSFVLSLPSRCTLWFAVSIPICCRNTLWNWLFYSALWSHLKCHIYNVAINVTTRKVEIARARKLREC